METREKSALEQLQSLFRLEWVCDVFTSGCHKCNIDDPHHEGWECGWRWVAPPLYNTKKVRELLDREES